MHQLSMLRAGEYCLRRLCRTRIITSECTTDVPSNRPFKATLWSLAIATSYEYAAETSIQDMNEPDKTHHPKLVNCSKINHREPPGRTFSCLFQSVPIIMSTSAFHEASSNSPHCIIGIIIMMLDAPVPLPSTQYSFWSRMSWP